MPRWSVLAAGLLLCGLLAACNLEAGGSAALTPTPDLPRVDILAPANNSRVEEGLDFAFDIVAQDSAGIARVELRIDEQTIHEAAPPDSPTVPLFRVSMNWRATTLGQHLVEVIAYRADGTPGIPAQMIIEVVAAQ
ncbi:MAG: Ig-like domain-containing protein [Anaerolineae bacterium]|jgi:hypothetical protein|nr:Ig-like domain-containing protein [Anaerolineae bacterium]